MTKSPYYSCLGLPFNVYGGSTTFGAYDTIGNTFSKVRRAPRAQARFMKRWTTMGGGFAVAAPPRERMRLLAYAMRPRSRRSEGCGRACAAAPSWP